MSTISPTRECSRPTTLARSATPVDRRYWSVATAVTALPLVLGFYRLGEPSLWFDEAATWLNVSDGWRWLGIAVVSGEDCGGFLYALVMKLWTSLFGYGETALRAPSVLFAAAMAPVLLHIGRSTESLRAGVCMAICGALHPIVLCWSRQARAYGLELFLTTAYLAVLLSYARGGGRRRAALLTLVGSLLALTHVFGVFVVAGGTLLLLVRRFDRSASQGDSKTGRSLVPSIVAGMLWGLWIFTMQGRVKQNLDGFWIEGSILDGYRNTFLELVPWYAAITLPLIAALGLKPFRRSSTTTPSAADSRRLLVAGGLILAVVLIGPAVVSAMSRGAHHFVLPRYFMPAVVPVIVVAGLWLGASRTRATIGVSLFAAGGLFTTISTDVYSDAGEDGSRARAASQYLAANFRPGDRLYITPQYEAATLRYYGVPTKLVRGVGYFGERRKLRDVLGNEPPQSGARNWVLVYHCDDHDDLGELGLAERPQLRFGTMRLVRLDGAALAPTTPPQLQTE